MRHQLEALFDPLGIMEPQAMEGTAFEEYGGPDAGAVMDREPLDIEHDTFQGLCLA
jgi:hypothetical protein